MILSADRLFGLSFWSAKQESDAGISDKASGTAINLVWGDNQDVTLYSIPRFAFDYMIVQNVSVGGSFGFIHRSASDELSGGNASISHDLPSRNGFTFAPRAGYVLGLSPTFALWLRAGITYFTDTVKQTEGSITTKTSANGISLDLEPQLVILPVPHLGLTLGPVADIGLGGKFKQEITGAATVEYSSNVSNYGLVFGLLGYL